MRQDLWRLLGIVLLSVLIGLLTGHTALALAAGLFFFSIRQYLAQAELLAWLKRRADTGRPAQAGLVDELCREIQQLRNHYRARNALLAGYLKRFQRATTAIPDAVIILGRFGEIEWANRKAGQYMGICWPQDNGLRLLNLVRDPALADYLGPGPETRIDALQLDAPANAGIRLEIRASPYGAARTLLVARDVTGISRNNQMRKDFIANASHELRTPLTVIAGYLESFADDELCPGEWRAHIEQMRGQTGRMQSLIADLLQLSSLEAGAGDDIREAVAAPEMLAMICDEIKKTAAYRDHAITIKADPGLYFNGDPRLLYSAFSNLIFNAAQYTPAEGLIEVEWRQDAAGLCFSVRDNGLGIDAAHIPRLTERFYRIDKGRSRARGGTGLGLAIVKHILGRYGATLQIESEPGQGSLFRCRFPGTHAIRMDAPALPGGKVAVE